METLEEPPLLRAVTDVQPPQARGLVDLVPENTKLLKSPKGAINVEISGELTLLYENVVACLVCPISHPDRFVSVRYFPSPSEEREIGIIDEPSGFPQDQQKLLTSLLRSHYFEFQITGIVKIENKWGFLLFDVETKQGSMQFEMPWRVDCTEDIGRQKKVLLDAHGNRYVVDKSELSKPERERLTRYIYW